MKHKTHRAHKTHRTMTDKVSNSQILCIWLKNISQPDVPPFQIQSSWGSHVDGRPFQMKFKHSAKLAV